MATIDTVKAMFGGGTIACPRCEAKNAKDAEFCASCGIPLFFHRDAFLKDNRWEPAPDEFAVFFRVGELKGIFSKLLHVGAGTTALVIQGGQVRGVVPPGDYTIESFFSRLNNLFQDQHAEILITRQAALPITINFDDALSAEFLKLGVTLTVGVKVGDVANFSSHFMTTPGSITVRQLHDLLEVPVRQTVGEFTGTRSLREMAGQPTLRDDLNQMLLARLKSRFAGFGLAIDNVDAFALHHDKFSENRELVGSLWLVADEKRVRIEHQKQLDELYSLEEWNKIKREEEEIRLRLRRSELKADEGERAHVVRMREIELLGRVLESENKKKAIELNAKDAVDQLEHELTKRGWDREDEAGQWTHIRELARIRLQSELEISKAQAGESIEIEKLRVANAIEKIRIGNEIDQALQIENEDIRRERVERARRGEVDVDRRDREIKDARQHNDLLDINLEGQRSQREFERIDDYEKVVNESRKRGVVRKDEAADFEEETHQLQELMKLREQKRQADWQLELQRIEAERVSRLQEAEIDRNRLEALSKVSIETLMAVAQDPHNIQALSAKAELDAFKGMTAEQIQNYALLRAPHAAEALKAKFAQGSEAEVERMQKILDLQREHSQTMKEFAEKALKQVGDTAQGVAQAGGVNAMFGASLNPGLGMGTGAPIKCPHCVHLNYGDSRFCSKCGKPLS